MTSLAEAALAANAWPFQEARALIEHEKKIFAALNPASAAGEK